MIKHTQAIRRLLADGLFIVKFEQISHIFCRFHFWLWASKRWLRWIPSSSTGIQFETSKVRKKEFRTPLKVLLKTMSLREKCPYSEFFCSVFSFILTEYGDIARVFPYSVQMQENTVKKLRIRTLFTQCVKLNVQKDEKKRHKRTADLNTAFW